MKTHKVKIGRILCYVLLSIVAVLYLYPLFYLICYSFKSNEEIFGSNPFGITFHPLVSNYVKAFEAFNIVAYFKNSVIVTLVGVFAVLALALPFSYAVTRMQWKFKGIASTYLMIGLFIPVQAIIIPLSVLIRDLHLANSLFSLIVPYTAFRLGFAVMVLSIGFMGIPKEMEEAAFIDGASVPRFFAKIAVPMIKPSIATTVIFTFLNIWNEYSVATVLIHKDALKTLPLGLSSFVGEYATEWGPMGATFVIASIPTIVMYLVMSENIEHALSFGSAVKG